MQQQLSANTGRSLHEQLDAYRGRGISAAPTQKHAKNAVHQRISTREKNPTVLFQMKNIVRSTLRKQPKCPVNFLTDRARAGALAGAHLGEHGKGDDAADVREFHCHRGGQPDLADVEAGGAVSHAHHTRTLSL